MGTQHWTFREFESLDSRFIIPQRNQGSWGGVANIYIYIYIYICYERPKDRGTTLVSFWYDDVRLVTWFGISGLATGPPRIAATGELKEAITPVAFEYVGRCVLRLFDLAGPH